MLTGLRAVVFDLDGTLVDSQLDFVAMRSETGCPENTGLLEFVAALESAQARERTSAVIHRHELAGAGVASWMPGAQQLLLALRRAALPIGIFTRNSRQAAGLMLQSLDIPCDVLIAREDAAAKPDPQGLLMLAQGWDVHTDHLLYVGDFRYDLEAAANAGVPSCLYDPQGDSPYRAQADWVIAHFDELGKLIFGVHSDQTL